MMTKRLDPRVGRHVFGDDAAGYAAGRPDYPDRLYEILTEKYGLRPGTRIFEIGPGTGQATKRLLERCPGTLTAIEPDQRLALSLAALASGPGGSQLDIRNESFEDVDLPPASYGFGLAATSFHWLDAATAFSKILALLEPGGGWAMWWSVFHDPAGGDPFSGDVHHLLEDIPQPPSFRNGRHYSLDSTSRLAELERAGFVDARYELVRTDRTFSAKEITALYATFSAIRQLAADDRDRTLEAIRTIAEQRYSGRVQRTMLSPVYTARKPVGESS